MQIKLLNSEMLQIYPAAAQLQHMRSWSQCRLVPIHSHAVALQQGSIGGFHVVNSWGEGWPRNIGPRGVVPGLPAQQAWPVSEVANAD